MVTRHTYGSNLEAQARADGKDVKSTVTTNMGHNSSQTYEQHYRSARTRLRDRIMAFIDYYNATMAKPFKGFHA